MKHISKILLIILCVSTSSAYAKKKESEYGYIFVTEDSVIELFEAWGDSIDVISGSENIYHADSLEDIEQFTSTKNVKLIAEDCPVELYDYPSEDIWYEKACNINSFTDNGITGQGVTVAVVDTGLYTEHEAFDNINIGEGANLCAYLDKDESKYTDISDMHGHGTAVTSVITNISTGTEIIPLKIYDTSSQYSLTASSILAAMQYALSYDIDIVNFSAGFSNPSEELIQITQLMADKFTDNGAILISATGNRGDSDNRAEYPASCEGVVGVGAVNQEQTRASFSTANESIYVTAPGYGIWCADISGRDSYIQKNGTSFSAPIVTALAAGVKQIEQDMNAERFKKLLIETAIDLDTEGYDTNTGYGMVDFNAVYSEMYTGTYITAIYDTAGRLLEIHITENYTAGEGVPEIEIDTDEEYIIKNLFWDSLNTMRPIGLAKSI